jgi:O-Antigen ligase
MIGAALFAMACAVLIVLALWRYPICGLYFYFLAFYIHPPSRWWGYILPDLRWSLLAAAVTVLALTIHGKKLTPGRASWVATGPGIILLTFVGYLWLQLLWAVDLEEHGAATIQYTKYVLTFHLMYRLSDTPRKVWSLLGVHVAGCTFLGWLCFTTGRGGGDRLDGVGGPGIDDANTLGMMMVTGFVVAAMMFLYAKGRRRFGWVIGLPLMLNGMVLAGSRGAFLGLFGGLIVVYFLRPPKQAWVFGMAAVLGLALGARVVDQQFIDRMLTVKTAVKGDGPIEASAESRLFIVEAQVKMFASYPLGAGNKGTAWLSPQYLDESLLARGGDKVGVRSSHNTFMTFLVEQGIPGVILFVWAILWGLGTVLRIRRLQKQGAPPELVAPAAACCAALAVVAVSGNFTDYLLAEVQIWMFALLLSSLEQLRRAEPAAAPAAVERDANALAAARLHPY